MGVGDTKIWSLALINFVLKFYASDLKAEKEFVRLE